MSATTLRDPLTLDLSGLHLIEASAGTGKTYTITHLVLRLVELGQEIGQILVLTFTEAATQELRERIARRLREARHALSGRAPEDPVLAAWTDTLDDQVVALARVEQAIADLDRSAIHTIHGFCQRVLRDYAFESGTAFDAELIQDESELRQTAAQDFWRRRLGQADAAEAAWLLGQFKAGPASLLTLLDRHLRGSAPEVLAPEPEGLSAELARLDMLAQHMAAAWPESREAVSAILETDRALHRNKYRAASVATAIAEMDRLANDPGALAGGGFQHLHLFTATKLAASIRGGHSTPTHPFFDLCDALTGLDPESLARRRRAALLAEALAAIRGGLARAKHALRVTFFDDLLTQTAEALEGPQGPALAASLRRDYPHALIDEFQDTDDLQYRIFRRIYAGVDAPDARVGLYLIGDPKQAIYAFRGADVFTYMAARRHAQDQGCIHTLGQNHRSASALVKAVNQIFGRAAQPFIFDSDIPFEPVEPGPRADEKPLTIDGAPPTPLVIRWLPLVDEAATRNGRRLAADPARELAADDCARQIAALLGGRARLGDAPLQARDVAVLVRSHKDGAMVRRALSRHGIDSVSIGPETVFESEEAEDLAAILAALRPGAGDAAVRTALATRTLGWTLDGLARSDDADGEWAEVLADFAGYRETWRRQGFMAAFTALLHARDCPARLRRGEHGERRLSNLLQLAELAQAAAPEHPGPEALMRWLADRRAEPRAAGDAALLRLESDENLVQVVTFHKSKGLEYAVVFVPMPWGSARPSGTTDPLLFHDRETLAACLDLGSDDHSAHRRLADEESLAEGLRLLYVALTRARKRCVIHWGPVNQTEGSAGAWLLHQGPDGPPVVERMKVMGADALRSDLEALASSAPECIALEELAPDTGTAPAASHADTPELRAAVFQGRVPDRWRLLSFSGLAGGPTEERPDHDPLTPGETPDSESLLAPDERVAAPPDPIYRFPRGVRAGHCLHGLFETLDFRETDAKLLREAARDALARHGIDPEWSETLATLARRVLDTPLTTAGLRLAGVGPEDRRNELEFHFSIDGFDPAALAGVLRRHGLTDADGIAGEPVDGLVKGFVDLVLRADGRFYVVDYKSNHLGDHPDDYDAEGLARAMDQHRYRLQLLIYTLALHRWLTGRLPGYDYDSHQGGSLYLFLRGMRPELGHARGVYHARPSRALIEDLDGLFGHPPVGPALDRAIGPSRAG
jgi:exodeoxyribonuclease V beta subunit